MNNFELNILNALVTAKEIVSAMMQQGFGEAKDFFVAANAISEKFSISRDQAITVLESAFYMLSK
jgi:hypothetical protein